LIVPQYVKPYIQRNKVTPQVVDKFVFDLIKLNRRHPERSEGSPEFGTNQVN
jgi:hypothetical protein